MLKGDIPVFPGARPFSRAESGRFFGRTAEAARLVTEWLRNPLTFLTGPAGIGKTSLLAAGVLPFVERQRSVVSLLPVGEVSGRSGSRSGGITGCPLAALKRHNPYSLALLQSWSGASDPTHLAGVPTDDFIEEHAQYHPDVLILAAIDQADDLFAGPLARQQFRRRFLAELAAALAEHPRLRLLISVRSDILPRFTEVLGDGVQFFLDPLTPSAAFEAVAKPGYFTPDTADELVRSLRTSRIVTAPGEERLVITDEVEPALLQVVCASLWESTGMHAERAAPRDPGRHRDLTVDTALAGYCSAAIAAVAAVHEIPVDWLRTWLIDTFITEVGELGTAPERHPETAGTSTAAVRALEDRYLLRGAAVASRSGERLYRLLSDRLVEPLREIVVLTPRSDDDSLAEIAVRMDPEESLRAAIRARIMGEHDLAGKLAAQIIRVVPETDLRRHAEAHSLIGDLAYDQGHTEEAETSYLTAMGLFQACNDQTSVGRLFAAIAQTLIDRGRLVEALQQLAAAINRIPDLTLLDELADVMAALAQGSAQAPPFRSTPI